MKHNMPGNFLTSRINMLLVGAGGNGSQMLTGLARLNAGVRALGHPGLNVTVCDPDHVTEANVGRQLFSPADVGLPKAEVLVYRLNTFFGLDWEAQVQRLDQCRGSFSFVIGCVDTAAARREIAAKLKKSNCYWLDRATTPPPGRSSSAARACPMSCTTSQS